ncbi:hypothetical protein EDC01DRAFT_727922 [Geopyxis carbonaria]|nr:hypothetical protein EDC01DRAFT_727922 [Geopyxis carbonaria]
MDTKAWWAMLPEEVKAAAPPAVHDFIWWESLPEQHKATMPPGIRKMMQATRLNLSSAPDDSSRRDSAVSVSSSVNIQDPTTSQPSSSSQAGSSSNTTVPITFSLSPSSIKLENPTVDMDDENMVTEDEEDLEEEDLEEEDSEEEDPEEEDSEEEEELPPGTLEPEELRLKKINAMLITADATPPFRRPGYAHHTHPEYLGRRRLVKKALAQKPDKFYCDKPWSSLKGKARENQISKAQKALGLEDRDICLSVILGLISTQSRLTNRVRHREMLASDPNFKPKRGRPVVHGKYAGRQKRATHPALSGKSHDVSVEN